MELSQKNILFVQTPVTSHCKITID